jgi:hypothetical protein
MLPLPPEVVRLLSNDYQTTNVLYPPRGRVEGEERAFGEGRRDNPRMPSVSALPALARLGSLRDPPKGRVNLSRTTCPGEGSSCPLPSARCPLPSARCLLASARCPLPSAQIGNLKLIDTVPALQ